MDFQKNQLGLVEPDGKGLEDAAGFVFYNTRKWTLKKLYSVAYKNNQDTQTRILAFQKIFEDVMLKKRRDELEL